MDVLHKLNTGVEWVDETNKCMSILFRYTVFNE